MNYNTVAYYAYFGRIGNFAFQYIAACNKQFGNCNQLAYFHASLNNFFKFRREHAFNSCFNVVNRIINYPVSTYVNLFGFGSLAGIRIRADIKANNKRIGSRCQHYVGFGNGTNAGMNYYYFYFIIFNIGKRRFKCFNRALNVSFNNNIQFFQLAFLNTLENIIQGNFGILLHFFAAAFCKAFFSNASGGFFVSAVQNIASHRHFVQTKHFNRCGRQRFFNFFAAVINHCTYFAVSGACNNRIADA